MDAGAYREGDMWEGRLQSSESGIGEQFQPVACRAKARVKEVFVQRHLYDAVVLLSSWSRPSTYMQMQCLSSENIKSFQSSFQAISPGLLVYRATLTGTPSAYSFRNENEGLCASTKSTPHSVTIPAREIRQAKIFAPFGAPFLGDSR